MSYSREEIQLINKTTTEFYATVADSFSETRQHEWDGWKNCLQFFHDGDSVLDLGCGNRRFEKFLTDGNCHIPTRDLWQRGYPNCHIENIDNYKWDDKVKQVDIIDALLNSTLNLSSYDVAVCFGVMHHIPTSELRFRLLQELTKSKIAIVSFWQFEKDERIFTKAQENTRLAEEKLGIKNLYENDYFLSWKDREDVFRFCHNFTDAEIESIANKYNVVEKYNADGSQALNCYLILKENNV